MVASIATLPDAICRALRRSKSEGGGAPFEGTLGLAGGAAAFSGRGVAADFRSGAVGWAVEATRGLAFTLSTERVACSHRSASVSASLRLTPGLSPDRFMGFSFA